MDAFRVHASTVTRIRSIDPTTPAGLSRAFAEGAGECLIAAETLNKSFPDLTGEYIVTFHAIELALKAYLLKHGVNLEELRKRPYGHDLSQLYGEAVRLGLALVDPDAGKMIDWVNEWHCDDVKIRYEFVTQRTLPMCATLFPLVKSILVACN